MANLFDVIERYGSMHAYYASNEFAMEPLSEVLAAYAIEFNGDSIYHFNDPKNPKNDAEAKKMAIECLIADEPRPWDGVPEGAVI